MDKRSWSYDFLRSDLRPRIASEKFAVTRGHGVGQQLGTAPIMALFKRTISSVGNKLLDMPIFNGANYYPASKPAKGVNAPWAR